MDETTIQYERKCLDAKGKLTMLLLVPTILLNCDTFLFCFASLVENTKYLNFLPSLTLKRGLIPFQNSPFPKQRFRLLLHQNGGLNRWFNPSDFLESAMQMNISFPITSAWINVLTISRKGSGSCETASLTQWRNVRGCSSLGTLSKEMPAMPCQSPENP